LNNLWPLQKIIAMFFFIYKGRQANNQGGPAVRGRWGVPEI
jgi:hypothetical protein